MYINTFRYTAKDVDCKFCTEYERKTGCTANGCPWLNERIEAGVMGYADAVIGLLGEHISLHPRLRQLFRNWPDSPWSDGAHMLRMNWLMAYLGYSRKRDTPEFYAAMYLLTANADIYSRTINCFRKQGFEYLCAKIQGISPHDYTLFMAARGICDDSDALALADLSDVEVVDAEAFRLIVNAMLIVRYGLAALNLGRRTEMDLDTKHISGHKLVAVERYLDSTRHMIEFDVLTADSPVGNNGERIRQFLDDAGYARALGCQKCKQIKIRRHAFVIEGNLVYDRKRKK